MDWCFIFILLVSFNNNNIVINKNVIKVSYLRLMLLKNWFRLYITQEIRFLYRIIIIRIWILLFNYKVLVYHNNSHLSLLNSIINVFQINLYINLRRLKHAYMIAVRINDIASVHEILQVSRSYNHTHVSRMCNVWLEANEWIDLFLPRSLCNCILLIDNTFTL